MAHHITTDNLVEIASAAVTDELFHEFNRILQFFCDEERDCTVIFRTLRYTRIRLYSQVFAGTQSADSFFRYSY